MGFVRAGIQYRPKCSIQFSFSIRSRRSIPQTTWHGSVGIVSITCCDVRARTRLMSSSIQGAFVETGCKLYPVFETHRERDRLTKTKEAQKVEKRLLHRESGAGFRYLDGVKRQGHVFQSEGSQTRKPFEQEEMIAGLAPFPPVSGIDFPFSVDSGSASASSVVKIYVLRNDQQSHLCYALHCVCVCLLSFLYLSAMRFASLYRRERPFSWEWKVSAQAIKRIVLTYFLKKDHQWLSQAMNGA